MNIKDVIILDATMFHAINTIRGGRDAGLHTSLSLHPRSRDEFSALIRCADRSTVYQYNQRITDTLFVTRISLDPACGPDNYGMAEVTVFWP